MRRVERARNWGLWLTTAACAAGVVGAAPMREAAAQEAPQVQADDVAAETAYLRAYFLERETKDLAAADVAYTAVLAMKGVTPDLAVRARVGRVRCLHGLGRAEEARGLLTAATAAAAQDGAWITAATRDALTAATARLNANAADDDSETLGERIIGALHIGDLKAVLPFGDRALSHLRNVLLTCDDVTLSSRAALAIATMDTDASRKHVKALMGQYDSLRFPKEFAVAVARSMPFDMVAEFAAPLPIETRRAMWNAALASGRPFTDADARRILADREARPAPSSSTSRTAGSVRYMLRALVDADAAFRAAAEEAVRSRRGSDTAEALDAWFAPPADALADERARQALVDGVYSSTTWDKATIAPEFLRAMARFPEGAGLYLKACASTQPRRQLADREALRSAVVHSSTRFVAALGGAPVAPNPAFTRLLEIAGLTEPEELRWLLVNWRVPVPIQHVVSASASLLTPTPAQVEVLLDPANPPDLLESVLSRLQVNNGFFRGTGAPVAAPHVVALLSHGAPSVRRAAAQALTEIHNSGLIPPDVDVMAIVRAWELGATRAAILAALPEQARRTLIPEIRADGSRLEAVLGALATIEDPEIERRLRELLATTSDPQIATIAVRTLLGRLKGAADPLLLSAITDASRPATLRAAIVRAGAEMLGHESIESARHEQFLTAGFVAAPGALPLGRGHPVPTAVTRYSAAARRRVAAAALQSADDDDRRFGAELAGQLRDPAAWDRLVVLAEDAEPSVRDAARLALDAIADEEEAVRRYRRLAATKKTRDEIPALLASSSSSDRLAGIAAVVAVEDDSQMAELVRLATKDADEAVRDAARRTLETLGVNRVAARDAAAPPPKPAPDDTPK